MKGDPAIIRTLNAVLTNELTAVNQYFLHARMFESWGLKHLGNIIYEESIGEMRHADMLIKRVLFLDGLPNMQDLHKLKIGENAIECLGADLQLELGSRDTTKAAVTQAEAAHDYVTRDLLMRILGDTEEHIDFLEAQFKLIEQLGEQNYLQSAMTEIAPDKSATGN
ncbi:bacterioferritin [Brevundimonas sp. Leaf363]|uniref:bacterioferritin n=1 Tax=Brevundimonas sp. Leaf363 TaxID=1736353 RepID=UPI0006F4DD8B|nr:bacterioferritin [Brevundimonas sp. Leaf363]KQS54339.1 bacterioferritin [Brevundimonas sp. Leaf363]